MRIQVTHPSLMADLVAALRRGEIAADVVDDTTCRVVHGPGDNAREARVELTFFLRAWQRAHDGVEAVLLT